MTANVAKFFNAHFRGMACQLPVVVGYAAVSHASSKLSISLTLAIIRRRDICANHPSEIGLLAKFLKPVAM